MRSVDYYMSMQSPLMICVLTHSGNGIRSIPLLDMDLAVLTIRSGIIFLVWDHLTLDTGIHIPLKALGAPQAHRAAARTETPTHR